ncbi:hypothetical protein [Dactylosporangium sp. CA-233914]|uniref:hypothetical protein n=1 Tax=Dactylosporangium sp. CA-233914 TaxID=3239934 RepID=UPI003D90AD34
MGGRSYMVATRIPMSRAGFDSWLTTPLPGLDVIENPRDMWRGWALDGQDADWEFAAIADSPAAVAGFREDRRRTPVELLAARAATGFTLARHREQALEIYLYDYHADVYNTQTELLMLAGAGRFADAEGAVMYWGGNVYPDLPIDGDEPLAVLLAGADGARFAGRYPVDRLIEQLRPVEAAFLGAVVDSGDENIGWDDSEMLDPAVRAQLTKR